MADLQLTFASQDYEHTRALTTGKVKAEGIDVKHIELFPAFTFQRMLGKREFDCCEMAMTLYFSTLDLPDPPFIAIPVFPIRCFRHSAFFVRAGGAVREPRDLIGKTVGEFFFYGHDAGLWAKGVLEDEYGVRHDSYSYKIGGVGRPFGPQPWLPAKAPARIKLEHIGAERTLDQMLEAGEIDAVVAPWAPPSILRGEGKLKRLFDDYESVERAYFAKTRIFPIMHTLVMRRDVYRQNPWVAASLYQAFKAAKDVAFEHYREGVPINHTNFLIPWMTPYQERIEALMGHDWWPYGIAQNRKVIDTFARYHHEQGLSKRQYTAEDLFAAETLGD
jgi:4,5-dihydroxyphthalate decarboxylase